MPILSQIHNVFKLSLFRDSLNNRSTFITILNSNAGKVIKKGKKKKTAVRKSEKRSICVYIELNWVLEIFMTI